MDWWQAGSVMGTVVVATTAVATFGWRVLRQETDKLRQESREAHDKIGERIIQVQVGLSAEIAQGRTEVGQVRDGLSAEIAQLRDGQAAMREGIGEIRGELRGVRHSLETLRGDFRTHVFGRQD